MITVTPERLVGFRRVYEDSFRLTLSENQPHHVFLRPKIIDRLLVDGKLPLDFKVFIENCRAQSVTITGLDVAGDVLCLGRAAGLLSFLLTVLEPKQAQRYGIEKTVNCRARALERVNNCRTSRLVGTILCGQRVEVDSDVVLVGPSVICSDVKVGSGAVIKNSVLGPGVSVSPGQLIQNQIILNDDDAEHKAKSHVRKFYVPVIRKDVSRSISNFRTWSRFSYAGCFKRLADVFAAMTVLILFAPVIPFVVLAIKITSSGPVFFKDKRQGFHGKNFNCLKFRTMLVGADKMQERLRVLNQSDGPQFMIDDDPRISSVGGFLRDTYLDEIPQFINVLFGQMSVVGPRPSPESENTLCPYWRDARLSVKPGITGLWQVYRTRQPMKDFQEWIYYDTKYVREISLKTDIWICWKTFIKMVRNFISQF